jgi:hypothetical protein
VVQGAGLGLPRGPEPVQVAKELWCDSSLAVRRVAYIVEGFEEGCEGGKEPGAVLDVKGLRLKSSRNAAARWPAAVRTVAPARAFLVVPRSLPDWCQCAT